SDRLANRYKDTALPLKTPQDLTPMRIYPFGIARNRLLQAAKRLGIPAVVVKELDDAEVLVTMRTYYRNRQQAILEAEQHGIPIYVLRANTINQMEQFLVDLFNLPSGASEHPVNEDSNLQTRAAIEAVLNGERWVDLPPANATMRRLQHEMARQAQLVSQSFGKEPNRRVRIYRD
ncbi:MAG: R3H domain-containing nucleic acid-binding protein, partial [Anaerolineaceae bacterium]